MNKSLKDIASQSILDESNGVSSGRVTMLLSLGFFLLFGLVGVVFAVFKNSIGTTFCLGMATVAMGKGVADVFATQRKSAQVLASHASAHAPMRTPYMPSPSPTPSLPSSSLLHDPQRQGIVFEQQATTQSPPAPPAPARLVRAMQMAMMLASPQPKPPLLQEESSTQASPPQFLLHNPTRKERFFLKPSQGLLLDLALLPNKASQAKATQGEGDHTAHESSDGSFGTAG